MELFTEIKAFCFLFSFEAFQLIALKSQVKTLEPVHSTFSSENIVNDDEEEFLDEANLNLHDFRELSQDVLYNIIDAMLKLSPEETHNKVFTFIDSLLYAK